MFNLYQLRIFLTVVEEGSITRAAERLYLTQPAVSQHIRALEKMLGVKLFRRGRRGMVLTPAGKRLVSYAEQMLRLAMEARQAVLAVSGDGEATLLLGASPGAGSCLVPQWIHEFRTAYPNIRVMLRTRPTPEIVRGMHKGELEMAIVEGEVTDFFLRAIPLWDEEIVLVVGPGHPFWGRASVAPQELGGQRFITRESGSLTRAWEEHTLGTLGVRPTIVAEFDSPAAIKRAVQAGLGVALLPCFAVKREKASGELYALRIEDFPLKRTLRLLWLPDVLQNPAARAFLHHLAREFPHLETHLARAGASSPQRVHPKA